LEVLIGRLSSGNAWGGEKREDQTNEQRERGELDLPK
jgi:hypothetical protein